MQPSGDRFSRNEKIVESSSEQVDIRSWQMQAPDAEVPGASALGSPSFLAASLAWQLGRPKRPHVGNVGLLGQLLLVC